MISPAANLAMNGSAHSIETYWSYENGAPAKLFNNIQLLGNSNNDITGNFDRRAVISNLMGIKYWFVNNGGANPPATYKPISDKKINNQTVTKSDDVYPLAYTTDQVVSTKTFNRASPTKKEAYVAQGAVTNALPESATSDQFANQVKSVKIKKSANAKATQTVHYRFTSKNGAKPTGIYLPADASLAGNEIHLEVSNLKFKPFSLYQKATYATNAHNGKAKKAAALPDGKTDYATNTKAYKFNWLRNHANSIGKFVDGYRVTAKYGRTERILVSVAKITCLTIHQLKMRP
ncbi:Predicted membrane protein [Weissella viridescens]|uniref:Predicted membrane protein n=1 Tax=Weissella viridescens TaxID=1629 RepID=A0A380NY58_WEIVI|nr:Predicted membrane protein [Weissella viridescens]